MDDLISRQDAIDAMSCINDTICEGQAIEALWDLPSVQQEIIRCKDCKFYGEMLPKKDTRMICHKICLNTRPDDFCSFGERRTDE